jgi:ribonuclease T1
MKFIFAFFLSVFFFTSCNHTTDYKKGYQDGYADGIKATESNNAVVVNPNSKSNNQDPNSNPTTQKNRDRSADGVPQNAISVLDYVKKNHAAPDGFVGGRHFGNYEHLLPERDAAGNRIEYQEWDVNADKPNKNRGEQRLVTGSDGRNWYSNNHYKSFTQIK